MYISDGLKMEVTWWFYLERCHSFQGKGINSDLDAQQAALDKMQENLYGRHESFNLAASPARGFIHSLLQETATPSRHEPALLSVLYDRISINVFKVLSDVQGILPREVISDLSVNTTITLELQIDERDGDALSTYECNITLPASTKVDLAQELVWQVLRTQIHERMRTVNIFQNALVDAHLEAERQAEIAKHTVKTEPLEDFIEDTEEAISQE